MGFGIWELTKDCIEYTHERDINVFGGEALEIALIVCDEILLPPFESYFGCHVVVYRRRKSLHYAAMPV
jgi:hypothetical protein